ncbi:MAG TPA: hypothetical protein VE242_01940 [Chthoniobacterales bacterium]|nr:hypothetical protein [Chthoniobacterales bacterium]
MVFRYFADIRVWVFLIILGLGLGACERHPASQLEEQTSPSAKPETKKNENTAIDPAATPKTYFPQNS